MTTIYHNESPDDHAFMQAMRAELSTHPPLVLGPETRPFFDKMIKSTSAAKAITYEPATIEGVRGWWCRPSDAIEGAAILYLHGGAYVLGSAEAYCNFAGQIAARAKVAAFIADYRIAPEHSFPAAINDAEAVYRGLSAADDSRLALVGDSAGGGLALSLLVKLSKDNSVTQPYAAAVISPWTDLALTGDSMRTRAEADPLLTPEALRKAAALYVNEADLRNPHASPLYGDMSQLAPVLIHVGEDEILLDDSRRFAEQIAADQGTAELHIWQGMTHVFPSSLERLQAAGEALDNIGLFLTPR